MSPKNEQDLIGRERSSNESIPEFDSEVSNEEVVELEKPLDTSELGVVDVNTDPVLLEQEVKPTSSVKQTPEAVIAKRRKHFDEAIEKMKNGILQFSSEKSNTKPSGDYNKATKTFSDGRENGVDGLKNQN